LKFHCSNGCENGAGGATELALRKFQDVCGRKISWRRFRNESKAAEVAEKLGTKLLDV
jgi:hypothetical protein